MPCLRGGLLCTGVLRPICGLVVTKSLFSCLTLLDLSSHTATVANSSACLPPSVHTSVNINTNWYSGGEERRGEERRGCLDRGLIITVRQDIKSMLMITAMSYDRRILSSNGLHSWVLSRYTTDKSNTGLTIHIINRMNTEYWIVL